MNKTGNSRFTFCNLTDKRRKCVFIKLAVSARFIWRLVNNAWLPISKCTWESCNPEHHIQQARSYKRCPGNGKLGKSGDRGFKTDQNKPSGLFTIFHHQSHCLFLFSINTRMRVSEKNSMHLTGRIEWLFLLLFVYIKLNICRGKKLPQKKIPFLKENWTLLNSLDETEWQASCWLQNFCLPTSF